MSTIGQRLKMARESLGFDQASFAKALGQASRDTISRWERELNYPPSDVVSLMHEKFGIDAGWLITGEGEMLTGGAVAAPECPKVAYIDPAVQLVEEALAETGVEINERQKRAIIEIVREEMKDKTVDIIKAIKGGSKKND